MDMQELMAPGVTLKHMEGFRVACVPFDGPYEEIGVAFQRLLRLLRERRIRPDGPMMAIYFEEPGHESDHAKSEAAVSVIGDVRADGEVRVRELPPCLVASLIHEGPYARLPETYKALFDWIKKSGYERCGPVREVYCHDLSETPPCIFYAEIQVPVRRSGSRSGRSRVR